MAHALLKFDLADPDDAREHRYALAGREALIALEALDARCRNWIKYAEIGDEARRQLEEIRALIPYELTSLLQ
jgi:hypothetical protein